jgi:hypothetical protein
MRLLPPLTGHGGMEGGGKTAVHCSGRGGRGISSTDELIHADDSSASVILCRQDGEISTSGAEGLHRFRRGCSKPLCYEVIRSPWLRGGPRLWIIARRGLLSSRSLFLGGDALRTPARSGGGAQGLHCMYFFCFRVLCVKKKGLIFKLFLRTRLARTFLKLYLPRF